MVERRGPLYPVTQDGRYFVVRSRLWRRTDPSLSAAERERLERELMRARSALGRARRAGDDTGRASARRAIDAAKVALGERGAPWWTDVRPGLEPPDGREHPLLRLVRGA